MKSDIWLKSMQDELNALEKQHTWDVVSRESGSDRRILPCKWVFKVKTDSLGNLIKAKSRLVVCGNFQENAFGVYSPVLSMPSLRMLLLYGLSQGFQFRKLDISNAFVQSSLDLEDVYMEPPPGFHYQKGLPCLSCVAVSLDYDKRLSYGIEL